MQSCGTASDARNASELVEFGIRSGAVRGRGDRHGVLSSGAARRNFCMIPCRANWRNRWTGTVDVKTEHQPAPDRGRRTAHRTGQDRRLKRVHYIERRREHEHRPRLMTSPPTESGRPGEVSQFPARSAARRAPATCGRRRGRAEAIRRSFAVSTHNAGMVNAITHASTR